VSRTSRELTAMIELLGHCERYAVEKLLERVVEGKRVYGELVIATDPRDFVHEALQEALDQTFYIGVALARIEGSKRLDPDREPPMYMPEDEIDFDVDVARGTPTDTKVMP
jgi:hypothetical protein